MAICDTCGLNMEEAGRLGCTQHHVVFEEGEVLARIPHSDPDGEKCHDCWVVCGAFHHPGCDAELCPICGGQLISCGHVPNWELIAEGFDLEGEAFEPEPNNDWSDGYEEGFSIGQTVGSKEALSKVNHYFSKDAEEFSERWSDKELWEKFNEVMPSFTSRGLSSASGWFTVAQAIAEDYRALALKVKQVIYIPQSKEDTES